MTTKERKQIYLEIAEELSDKKIKHAGVCIKLGNRLPKRYGGTSDEEIAKEFPEFFMFVPNEYTWSYWWNSGDQSRVLALLFSAEMCE